MTRELQRVIRDAGELAERVRRDSDKLRVLTDKRDTLIRKMDEAGMTLAAIGAVVGMSGPGVKRVLDRGPS